MIKPYIVYLSGGRNTNRNRLLSLCCVWSKINGSVRILVSGATADVFRDEIKEVGVDVIIDQSAFSNGEPSRSTQSAGIIAVRNEEILHVVIKGKSNVLKGMGLGTLIGAGGGALLGFASGDDPPGWFSFTAGEKAEMGAVGLGAVGLVVGTVVGVASSSRDKIVEPLLDQDFSSLRPVARFSKEEPELLKKIKQSRRLP